MVLKLKDTQTCHSLDGGREFLEKMLVEKVKPRCQKDHLSDHTCHLRIGTMRQGDWEFRASLSCILSLLPKN